MSGLNRIADADSVPPGQFVRLVIQGEEHQFRLDRVIRCGLIVNDDLEINMHSDGLTLTVGEYTRTYTWADALERLR